MKRNFTKLMAAFALLALFILPLTGWGQTRGETLVYTLDGTQIVGSGAPYNAYASASEVTQNDITWQVYANTTINPWRIGGKSLSEVDRPVYSTTTMTDDITKIVVTHGTANDITVNSVTLIVSANADFTNPESTITGVFAANSTTTFEKPSGKDWSQKYFKFVYNVSVSGSSNKFIQFIKAQFYKLDGGNPVVSTPTFTPDGGNFLDSQEISIACATEGATIHYTIDGTTPTASSPTYSAPFTINATTTVKAIGVKANYDNSEVATAVFTKKTPMTVAEARTFIDGLNGATSDYEFVTGIISEIDEYKEQYHSITYWISDDGTTTDQLEAYGGISGIDGWTFSSIEDIHVGATVIIYGKLKKYGNIYEFDLNNQLISYTAPAVTVATPTFSPAAGTYTEIQTVTISCENEGADIFYTLDGSIPNDESTPYSGPITVSETTTIKAIAYYEDYASAVATAEYVINLPYSGPAYARVDNVSYLTEGVKVIFAARYDAEHTTQYYAMTNTATGKPTGVLFTSTTSGDFEVLPDDILNTENSYCWTVGITENGYTFTNAQDQTIGWSTGTNFAISDNNTVWVVVNGTSGEEAMVPNYTAFNIKNYSTINASTVRSFALNDNHNFGPYALSNNNTTQYNLSIDIFVQGAEPAATPFINANNVEIAYDATTGAIEYEIVNPVTGTALTASTDASWISNLTVGENAVSFTTTVNEGEEDRTATITLSYGEITKDITVTQRHFVIDFAELPFEWEGGSSNDFKALTGVTLYGNGSDYNSNHAPYLIKFDSTDDYILVKTNGQPGIVTIGVKMIGGDNTSTITVQGSADGDTFTDIETLTISGAQNDELTLETTNAFDENDRYVKLLFNKGSNVGVGPISIALPTTDPVIAVTPATMNLTAESFMFVNETAFNIAYQNIEVANYQSFGIQFYNADGEETEVSPTWLVLGVTGANDQGYLVSGYADANTSEARSAYFKVYSGQTYSNLVTINQAAAPQQYTLTIEPFENLEIFTFIDDEFSEGLEGAGNIQVTEGVNVMLSVSALEGYIIESLMVDGVEHVNDISDDLTYTFVMPDHDVTVSATAAELVAPDNYVRIASLDQLTDGCKVIIAARYNEEDAQAYYAMPSETTGRPVGVSFTSEISEEGEILPATLAFFEDNYYWTVTVTDTSYTFTNAEGKKIGYSSSTTFATNGNNTEWTIEMGTAGSSTMVPEYEGFVITNKNNDGRAFAFNGSVFGAYAKTNIAAGGYNFFLDFFVQTENTQTTVTQTIELTEGWNWISTYIEMEGVDGLAMLQESLNGNAEQIKQGVYFTEYDAEWDEWFDSGLTEMSNELMYLVKTITACEVSLEGTVANLSNHSITINPGWNWIGFPSDQSMTVEDAFANFTPESGDKIQYGVTFNEYDAEWDMWFDNGLTQLVPGRGYLYYYNGTTPQTLNFGSAK